MNAHSKRAAGPALETAEIPTLLFGARSHLPYATALIITLGDDPAKCRAWLKQVEPDITYGHEKHHQQAAVLAFTSPGLLKLGLPPRSLETFPAAFQSGMTSPGRDRVLGDMGKSASAGWRWGYQAGEENKFSDAKQCDAILVVYGETPGILEACVNDQTRRTTAFGLTVAATIVLQMRGQPAVAAGTKTKTKTAPVPMTEPFGFTDGVSQPVVRGTPRATGTAPEMLTAAGTFILGYPARNNYPPLSPLIALADDPARILPTLTGDDGITRADLGRNGSFLVVRQLQQDVDGFHKYCQDVSAKLQKLLGGFGANRPQDWLAAKMVGRWQNGSSLVRHQDAPGKRPDNSFSFGADDPFGLACPLGAHIRRANPRDSLTSDPVDSAEITSRHRLLRVGRPYMEGDKPAGLLFMCLNADIEMQFETVQQSWLNRMDFHGLRHESDPLMGHEASSRPYTIPTGQGPVRLKNLPEFVTVIGGGYFFMPSRAAVKYLAALK